MNFELNEDQSAFQDAARDTGCFPDVLNVHVAR